MYKRVKNRYVGMGRLDAVHVENLAFKDAGTASGCRMLAGRKRAESGEDFS